MIDRQIMQDEMKVKILEYVEYQSRQGFPFGELLVIHFQMFNPPENEDIYKVAAAIEILILSFDMLDDFEDNDSTEKPWLPETNIELNITTALMLTSANVIKHTTFEYKNHAISILLKYALQSVHGQHKDLLNVCRNETDYIEMTIEKSGSLVTMACLIGVVLATNECPPEVKRYSKWIGLIGQMNNDLRDISSWDDKNDLLNKKYTLPIIYILNHPDEEIKFIHDYYANFLDKAEILNNRKLINKKFIDTGARKYTKIIKRVYQKKVIKEIMRLDTDQYYKDLLLEYAH